MENEGKTVIRVGSRKSELALIQTNFVIDSLKKLHPEKEFTIVTMTTLGDRILDVSLPKIGEKSLFTKDLEDALRNNSVDFVVHSLKDLPTSLPEGLAIGAVFEREDPRDALVLREDLKEHTLETLPEGSVIGTSSLRRTAQLHGKHPQLSVRDVRGNLNTRLRKLDESGEYSALLLAAAGLQRMGWSDRISKILPCAELKYAVGQGALAVECRADNDAILSLLAPFNHAETYCRVLAERSFLKTLGGGCSAPVGVSTRLKPFDAQFKLSITGAVWSLDGATTIEHSLDQTFPQIRKTVKHKLSPDEEKTGKKIKTDDNTNPNHPEEVNRRITERARNLNCEDTRSLEEILALKTPKIFCGLIENSNMPLQVIEKCDELGKNLAESLITKGALEVMKVTQDLIRSSTVVKS
ncbi:porphobilinogen deaminase [Leguminivora glycinivorella]|uniref:porphobilinogen deaminase n=1 Tax=Leguminivora glycinivorella TaxID=1035111 RepID=UPI0020103AB1|nr:porphobilinogen deaminase [Leguminivora glycinivorella]